MQLAEESVVSKELDCTAPTMGSRIMGFGRGAKVLLTGPPGIGKSTLMRSVVGKQTCSVRGVLCLEKRAAKGGRRIGFSAILPTGQEKMFMIKKNQNFTPGPEDKLVGRYVVDVKTLNEFVCPELQKCLADPPGLTYIDEIGRAQAHSPLFFQHVRGLFTADCNILTTVVESDPVWSLEFKYSPQSWLINVREDNRNEMVQVIGALLNNYHLFEQLPDSQKAKVKELFFELISARKFIAAKKLFSNAIGYVLESRIELIGVEDSDVIYKVAGQTSTHVLKRNLVNGAFICDCDLSLGLGTFADLAPGGQTCSHELCISISEAE